MQHRPGAGHTNNRQVKQSFCGWLAPSCSMQFTVGIDFEDVLGREAALVQRTGGNGDAERLALDYGAEVPTGPQRPAAPVKIASQFGKVF